MARVLLSRDQVVRIDGVIAAGTRDLDVDIAGQEVDVTSWEHAIGSTLVLSSKITIRLLILWAENYVRFAQYFNIHPPRGFVLSIDGYVPVRMVTTNVAIRQPITGVVAWEVTCKPYLYQ
jgi:hypothetical protein